MNRPTAGPPPPDGARLNDAAPNPGPQDPGLQGPGLEAGPPLHPQHVSTRPVFYVHAPPPPPPTYLPYQWPMPFTYNPFTNFPGMGFGVVMPPFPPPPYMEAPAYILPHLQPLDYRRMLHPQAHPTGMVNQSRRTRPPPSAPFRETVNCEVQTEPTLRDGRAPSRGNPLISDSGHETASNSPSSSTSSSYKQVHVENCNSAVVDAKEHAQLGRMCTNATDKRGFNVLHPAGRKPSQSRIDPTSEMQRIYGENVRQNCSTNRNAHRSIWSVSSPDAPMSSSGQREDEVSTERRESVPDILMSWTPQETKVTQAAEKVLSSTAEHLPSYDSDVMPEKSSHGPTETGYDEAMAGNTAEDDATDVFISDVQTHKILKLPLVLYELHSVSRTENQPEERDASIMRYKPYHHEPLASLNTSHDKVNKTGNETVLHEDTAEFSLHQTSNCRLRRKMNESVWSVESLAAYVPSKEWMMQNVPPGPEVIAELAEEAENGLSYQTGNCMVERTTDGGGRRSSSDSVPMSDSWLIFSTPADKLNAPITCGLKDTDDSEIREPSKQDRDTQVDSPNGKITLSTPTKHVDRKGSSEPAAFQSPNQESPILPEQLEKSLSYEKEEEMSPSQTSAHNGVDLESEDYGNEAVAQLTNEQHCIHMSNQNVTVRQSKGHLVDCGTQCQRACVCENFKIHMEAKRKQAFKNSDGKRGYSGRPDNAGVTGHMQKNNKRNYQSRNKGQEKATAQPEAHNGYNGKMWKTNGGNGRNSRY